MKYVLADEAISIVYDRGELKCRRCDRVLRVRDVAFLTRTSPDQAFEPWCPECALTLSRWALAGALDAGFEGESITPDGWA